MSQKEKYIQYCADITSDVYVPLFSQPSWLDATANDWDVCIYEQDDSIVAALPYCKKGKLITKRIYLPDTNFYQSIIFFKVLTKEEQQSIAETLFRQLPSTIKSYFKLLPEYIDIDLSVLHYQKEIYYTYLLPKDTVALSLSSNHQRNIKKGSKQQYIIRESNDLQPSYQLLTSTFTRQGVHAKITFEEFEKINRTSRQLYCGKTLDCIDMQQQLLASIFIVEDAQTIYYLMGGYHIEHKNSGAMTYLLHHCIQMALQQQKDFNFCGSSKKTIAHYFEGFGAQRTPIAIWTKNILKNL